MSQDIRNDLKICSVIQHLSYGGISEHMGAVKIFQVGLHRCIPYGAADLGGAHGIPALLSGSDKSVRSHVSGLE